MWPFLPLQITELDEHSPWDWLPQKGLQAPAPQVLGWGATA